MRVAVVCALMVSLGGCGKTEQDPGDGGGGGGGAPRALSEPPTCTTDADCEGNSCTELSPGGYRVCRIEPADRAQCGSDMDRCCSTADCAEGRCVDFPLTRVCGDVDRYSVCAKDECRGDSCGAGSVCAPPGVLGAVAMCLRAACVRDADCTAAPGGKCALVEGCCHNPLGLLCAYPGSGCVNDRDCTVDKYCGLAPNETDTACLDKPRQCPQGLGGGAGVD